MNEYISREEARNALYEADAITMKGVEILNQFPAADVTEVRHGMWLTTPTGWVYCSVCGEEPPEETNARTKYCPNCGAKMDGGRDDAG